MTLRTVPSDRDVRIRSTAFRVDLGTRYVTTCGVSLVAGRSGGKRYTMRRMERGLWGGGGRETVNRKRKLSAVFLQPIQNPSYMSQVLLLCISFLRVLVVLYLRWHVYVSPKTYKWSGTFIIKDGRYTFTFCSSAWYVPNKKANIPLYTSSMIGLPKHCVLCVARTDNL
jgi:hypothetical protein